MLADFLKLLLRRWRLSVAFVVLALGAGGAVLALVPPVQESQAAVLFIPPNRDASVDGTVNPFLSLGGSLGVVPSVVQSTVTDARTVDKLTAAGFDAEYTVVVDVGQNAAPILRITADSHTASSSVATVAAVVVEIKAQLLTLQTSRAVDSRYYITTTVLTSTPKPLVVRTGQIQAAALAAMGVLGLGLGVVGLTSRDWRQAHHRRSETAAASGAPVDDDDGPGDAGGSGTVDRPRPLAVDGVIEWSATTTHQAAAVDSSSLPLIGGPRTTVGHETQAAVGEHWAPDRMVPVSYRSRRTGRVGVTPRRPRPSSSSDLHRGGASSGRGFGDGGA